MCVRAFCIEIQQALALTATRQLKNSPFATKLKAQSLTKYDSICTVQLQQAPVIVLNPASSQFDSLNTAWVCTVQLQKALDVSDKIRFPTHSASHSLTIQGMYLHCTATRGS